MSSELIEIGKLMLTNVLTILQLSNLLQSKYKIQYFLTHLWHIEIIIAYIFLLLLKI